MSQNIIVPAVKIAGGSTRSVKLKGIASTDRQRAIGHCQSKSVYFAKTSEPNFVAIDFPAFFRVDLSGSMAAPSI
jgi:hypothetical protein